MRLNFSNSGWLARPVKTMLIGAATLCALQSSAQSPQGPLLDPANMNLQIRPGDDFYRYANGTWMQNNPVPAKETRWGSFNVLRDFNIKAVKTLVTTAAANTQAAPGTPEKRVGDFFAAAMDSVAIDKAGFQPIKADLKKAASVKNTAGVLQQAAAMRTAGIASPLFGFYVGQDRKNPKQMVPQLSQGGTTLPDRDYYLKSDARSLKIQQAYKTYVSTLFALTGLKPEKARKKAEAIFELEKQMAAAQMSRVEMRDPYKTYNKFALADLGKATGGIAWQSLLAGMKVSGQDTVLVNSPGYFAALPGLLEQTPLDTWRAYLQWNVLKSAAPYLSKPFVDAQFAYTQALTGQKVPTPRWQRMASLTDNNLGELLGQLYVARYFKPEAKARMETLIANLVKAYEIRIRNLDWMSAQTKEKALAKLHAFKPKIAYPDKWKTYEGLQISRQDFFGNVRRADVWAYNDMVSQLGKPVDRSKWGMTPPTVNAYYSPVMNEIVFPAGILQFPFFDPNADDALNYGGIGAVIGHEISHGFDDSGSQYDKDGTLRNWWTPEDLARFKQKALALQQQFDAYTVLDTLHVNGKLTLGENIGDLGGLNAAYEAFKMTKQGQSSEKIDGFSPDQRFFLSWAQVWRGNILPESAAQLIITDPHAPGEYRTIGAPVNMDAWYEAFQVKPGDKLYKKPADRIRIW
ncbi:MAG: M13 family metallopeptidase [Adhaeribacter sp.]